MNTSTSLSAGAGTVMSTIDTALTATKPRLFDTYVLPPFMMWYAVRSQSMGRWPRRMLFIAGAMMLMRSYSQYKKGAASAVTLLKPSSGASDGQAPA